MSDHKQVTLNSGVGTSLNYRKKEERFDSGKHDLHPRKASVVVTAANRTNHHTIFSLQNTSTFQGYDKETNVADSLVQISSV